MRAFSNSSRTARRSSASSPDTVISGATSVSSVKPFCANRGASPPGSKLSRLSESMRVISSASSLAMVRYYAPKNSRTAAAAAIKPTRSAVSAAGTA